MPFITEYSGNTMKGSRMCTIAIYTPVRLNSSSTGESVRPSPISDLLIRPSFCSNTIHAATRTRTEVQNGSSTKIISVLPCLTGRFAIR